MKTMYTLPPSLPPPSLPASLPPSPSIPTYSFLFPRFRFTPVRPPHEFSHTNEIVRQQSLTSSPVSVTAKQEKDRLSVLGVTLMLRGRNEPSLRMESTTLKNRASLVAMAASPAAGATNISCAVVSGEYSLCVAW